MKQNDWKWKIIVTKHQLSFKPPPERKENSRRSNKNLGIDVHSECEFKRIILKALYLIVLLDNSLKHDHQ
jgi:hypothetical protein